MLELLLVILAILAFVLTVGVVAALGYRHKWQWTGLPEDPGDGTPNRPARPARTAWDWLQLLIVPLVVALATVGLTLAQNQRDRDAQDRRATDDQKAQDRRAAVERDAAAERAREDTLRTYLQQMSALITDHGLRTRPRVQRLDDPPSEAQVLARTLTFVALRQLDPKRKGLVVQFLLESDLITVDVYKNGDPNEVLEAPPISEIETPKVNLSKADLRGAVMPRSLSNIVPETDDTGLLSGSSSVRAADLGGADLRDADFRGRDLTGVSFSGADLRGADFTDAKIYAAGYTEACVSDTKFVRVKAPRPLFARRPWPPAFGAAEGRGVDFTGADLVGVDLNDSRFTDVKLDGAKGVKLPPDWTPTGKRMSDQEADRLCSGFADA